MQFITAISLFAVVVMAAPNAPRWNHFEACPSGLYANPQCCATDVLGVADLDCYTPQQAIWSPRDFQAVCASGGQRARCCVLPVGEQALLCETPVGVV
ncbi:fungal hydrophobin [Cordyceps fumosorosea ARSEF 2679]|uniref:Fungal hydrophobin n=1 Tax=Cordyceps fumosorosea (strain ARSEF 2679) TaxID=1081104 RepID=A0A162MT23_CORFA|nr:fungal hydrophobin [Cordyceps fumosorosea ARSEF 2679]OAA69879.1 fungal hydrophobin [Cordyceps fumosorosea ARSEF 2679]